MSIFTGVVTYIVLWWLSFFLVLPFGAHSQADAGEVVPGTEPGAPHQLRLVKKVLMATGLAAFFLMVMFAVIKLDLVDPFDSAQDPWAKSTSETP